jgi:hypothetical protein
VVETFTDGYMRNSKCGVSKLDLPKRDRVEIAEKRRSGRIRHGGEEKK